MAINFGFLTGFLRRKPQEDQNATPTEGNVQTPPASETTPRDPLKNNLETPHPNPKEGSILLPRPKVPQNPPEVPGGEKIA